MVPAGDATEQTMEEFAALLAPGDTIVDGGNANFKDSKRRHEMLKERGINFVDAGVSGGIWGMVNGYGVMVGGEPAAVKPLEPIFKALAPDDGGYVHCGPPGSGHYVKMVHNGIEYGLMQAYAEGFEILHKSEYPLDLAAIAEAWMHGTVIRSWLLELLGRAFAQHGEDLGDIRGYVEDSGEGRWTVQEAIDLDVPAPMITLSLMTRFRSRQDESYSGACPGRTAPAVRRPRGQDGVARGHRDQTRSNRDRHDQGPDTDAGDGPPLSPHRGARRKTRCAPGSLLERAGAVPHRGLRRDR